MGARDVLCGVNGRNGEVFVVVCAEIGELWRAPCPAWLRVLPPRSARLGAARPPRPTRLGGGGAATHANAAGGRGGAATQLGHGAATHAGVAGGAVVRPPSWGSARPPKSAWFQGGRTSMADSAKEEESPFAESPLLFLSISLLIESIKSSQ